MINAHLEQTMRDLFTEMNIMGSEKWNTIDVLRVFSREHRTLQQTLVRVVIIPILKHLAKDYEQGNYDGRNRESCALAHKMLSAVTEDDLYLPFT